LNTFDIRAAIASARRQYKAGAASALDALLQAHRLPSEVLAEHLESAGGVSALFEGVEHAPDFALLDRELCRTWRCAVVRNGSAIPMLAAEDPWDESLTLKVSRRIGQAVRPAAVSRALLDSWLATTAPGNRAASPLLSGSDRDGEEQVDGPIVDFVDAAVQAGFEGGASDIHFESDRRGLTVKHRLDGVMTRYARLDGAQQAQEVISRIKVLAQLDITERRLPQDGRFRIQFAEKSIDLRVSIMPSVFGEDAVLRLLDKAQLRSEMATVSLDLLGFDGDRAELIRELARQPSGMLLVTGPTGSGKTTTVYAALSEINDGREKIITIEDPVEYELTGVLQIPVNERKGLTFAKGLRSILRHDPDRILVGEIRDAETAEIAVQSALTGHVVFTTVHANSVADIIGRFRHFGLDMFGFMSSLNGVVVQRLLRRLCATCAATRAPTLAETRWLVAQGQADVSQVPIAVGCPSCHGTGFQGRFVASEVHVIDDAFRDDVTNGAALSVLRAHATGRGIESLPAQAARRVIEGLTTTEEVKRVVGWL
jgi:general secretion pathway protein E